MASGGGVPRSRSAARSALLRPVGFHSLELGPPGLVSGQGTPNASTPRSYRASVGLPPLPLRIGPDGRTGFGGTRQRT